MENEASKSYGSFPDRLYIVLNGKIVYQVIQLVQHYSINKTTSQGGVGPHGYNTADIESWLSNFYK